MGTIVQEYGPIYGEAVNGTVQGRPNGSVYVPLSNTIDGKVLENYRYITESADHVFYNLCNSSGVVSLSSTYDYAAQAQDLASYVLIEIYSDSDLTDKIGNFQQVAGKFNGSQISIFKLDDIPEGVDTVYIISRLMNNGTAIATSDTIPMGVIS